jgi:hypothetical protein
LDENCTELAKWMKIVKTGPHFKLAQNCTETGTLNANCTKVTLGKNPNLFNINNN